MTEIGEVVPRVLILGSCVSRDILNFAGTGAITLADYFARSSLASIGSAPFYLDDAHYARITSDFQRRMVRRDLEKTLLHELARRQDIDFIVIDLIDERFDLYEAAPGSVVTVSSEFLATGLVRPEDRASDRWIRSGSERHRELWKVGLAHLFAVLEKNGNADRVVVNKVFWADRMEDGVPLAVEDEQQRAAANNLLAWMYEELAQYVPSQRWMTFSDDVLRSNATHRWGIAPFHYADAYYARALSQLTRLHANVSRDGAAVLENGHIVAWSGTATGPVKCTSFLVFKDSTLLHKQSYSAAREMQFDTRTGPGDYEVVVFTLVFDPAGGATVPPRRQKSRFRLRVERAVSEPSRPGG